MKIKILLISLLCIMFSSSVYSWGDKGHRLIISKAIELLPEEISFLKNWKEYLIDRVTDPDSRKDYDNTEYPKHFIDLDFYDEFMRGSMVSDKQTLIDKYGEEKVTEIGLLPWATLESFNNLKIAFADKDRDRILFHIADLAHYVSDGHQPLHTVLNYNGQLTGQTGVHARYEIDMVDKYLQELETAVPPGFPMLSYDPLDYIFSYLTEAHFKNEILISADRIATQLYTTGTDDYYRILWYRTKNLTTGQINDAAASIASLIYTAWNDSGKPDVKEIK